jgi:hypothetical protein
MDSAFRVLLACIFVAAACVLPVGSGAAVPLANSKAYDQAQFVFAGTVVRAGSNVVALAADAPSIVVRVDRVYKGSPVFRDLAGRQVTVIMLAGAALPQNGSHSIFITSSYLFAENAAVREIAIEPFVSPDQMNKRVATLNTTAAANRIRTSLVSSELVIVGQVVTEPRTVPVQRSFGEHDPELRAVDIAVSSVERGKIAGKTVTVLFASSDDERWLLAPKLTRGERAIFSLQHDRQIGAASGLPTNLASAYTAYLPDDVRPLNTLPAIRSALLQFGLR